MCSCFGLRSQFDKYLSILEEPVPVLEMDFRFFLVLLNVLVGAKYLACKERISIMAFWWSWVWEIGYHRTKMA